MWQSFVATGYRDVLTRLVELATSAYFPNGYDIDASPGVGLLVLTGGSGYTEDDVLTISHPSGLAPCQFVVGVDDVDPTHPITRIKRIINGGSFSNRIATVSVVVAGTGYAVGDVVQVLGGVFTNAAKVQITSISGGGGTGPATGVQLFEDGGSYVTPPPLPASTSSSIGLGTGTGMKLNMTLQGVIVAPYTALGGSGSGAQFTGGLSFSGWTALRNANNFSFNGVLDEKEVVLQGVAAAGQVPPIVGIRTGTHTGPNTKFLSFTGFTAFDPSSSYDAQPNAINSAPSTTAGQYVSVMPAGTTIQCWVSGTQRALFGVIRADGPSRTVYHSYYVGLLDPFGTATENPYPMVVMASHNSTSCTADLSNGEGDFDLSGLTECYRHGGRSGPCVAWSQTGVAWVELFNASATAGVPPWGTINQDHVVFPVGKPQNQTVDTTADYIVEDGGWAGWSTICRADGDTATILLKPSPDASGNAQVLFPVLVIFAAEGFPLGALNNVFWASAVKADGTSIAPEDTFTVSGSTVYRVFQNGGRTKSYSFFAMREGR